MKLEITILNKLIHAQRTELTESIIYDKLAHHISDEKNVKLLHDIAAEERRHHDFWHKLTEQEVKPYRWRVWRYYLIARVFGLTFGIKLMEQGEHHAQELYEEIAQQLPEHKTEIVQIIKDEQEHEQEMMNLIVEDRFTYVSSMVLGLNDALVELTGALAGLTLALANTRIIAMVGLITGVAASFSMVASEYLSIKSEGDDKNPLTAATYTGIAYLLTVLILITPFLLNSNVYLSLGISISSGIAIIAFFTYYTAIAQNIGFKKRFLEMTFLSLGVALISFGFGYVIKMFFDIEV